MNKVNIETGYTIEDIEALFDQYGIAYRKGIKGDYRIMGMTEGSSINLNKKSIVIYTRDDDFKRIKAADISAEDLVLIENGNLRDACRANKITCHSKATLNKLLAIYAMNEENK